MLKYCFLLTSQKAQNTLMSLLNSPLYLSIQPTTLNITASWAFMGFPRLPWAFISFPELRWAGMGLLGLIWASLGLHWLTLASQGFHGLTRASLKLVEDRCIYVSCRLLLCCLSGLSPGPKKVSGGNWRCGACSKRTFRSSRLLAMVGCA